MRKFTQILMRAVRVSALFLAIIALPTTIAHAAGGHGGGHNGGGGHHHKGHHAGGRHHGGHDGSASHHAGIGRHGSGRHAIAPITAVGIIDWRPITGVTSISPVREVTTEAGISPIIAEPQKERDLARERQPAERRSVIGHTAAGRAGLRQARKRMETVRSEVQEISTPTRAIVVGTAALTTAATAKAGGMGDSSGCAFPRLAGCSFRAGRQ